MKSIAWLGAVLFALAMTAPVSAQVTIQFGPPVPGFSNYYPWFNDVPQYRGDQSFRYFLANHPNVARELARNPGLLYNANWRRQHPDLEQYLNNHPYVWQALNNQYWSTGPAETQWGDYDDQHQWRDAYWWHQNRPDYFYKNHQDWSSLNPRWRQPTNPQNQQRNAPPQHPEASHQRDLHDHQQEAAHQQDLRTQQQEQQRQAATREQEPRDVQQPRNLEQPRNVDQQQSVQHEKATHGHQQPQPEASHGKNKQDQQQQAAAREKKQKPEQAATHEEHQQPQHDQQQDHQHGGGNDKP